MPEPVCQIDDFGPLPVRQPASVDALGELVRQAAAQGQAIYPLGGQTLLHLGLPPTRPGIGLEVGALAEVIDYPARDLTITVQAGIRVKTLQEILAREKQRLPIDVPQSERATLGGILATNVSGAHRYGFGTLRDYVIGMSAVNDEGEEIKAGGRVVKNVAGYDLCKLFIGALGTLGIITQVTLKLQPQPEEQALLLVGSLPDALDSLLDTVQRSRTRPVCWELLNQAAARSLKWSADAVLPETPWMVAVGFEDNRPAVQWQCQQLQHELAGAGFAAEPRSSTDGALWQALAELPARSAARLAFKANVLPSYVTRFCRQAAGLSESLLLDAHAGNGIVIGQVEADLTLPQAERILKDLQETATAGQGNLVVLRCPPAWKRSLPLWGTPRGDRWLMRTVKEKLDPRHLFNPGRFVVGPRDCTP